MEEKYKININKNPLLLILKRHYADNGITSDIKVTTKNEYQGYGMNEKNVIVPVFTHEREVKIGNYMASATSEISLEEIKEVISGILLKDGLVVSDITFNTYYVDYYESCLDFSGITVYAKLTHQIEMKRKKS